MSTNPEGIQKPRKKLNQRQRQKRRDLLSEIADTAERTLSTNTTHTINGNIFDITTTTTIRQVHLPKSSPNVTLEDRIRQPQQSLATQDSQPLENRITFSNNINNNKPTTERSLEN